MVKNFKNLFLWNQEADNFETWYTASGTQVPPMFSYDYLGLTLTIFKKLELLAFLDFYQPDVVAIQETDSSIVTSELFLETCP